MDALDYFLMLHREAHKVGKGWRVLRMPTPPEAWRVTLPDHNSIAWCVWHCAQTEDWGISALRGDDMLVRREGWEARLGFAWPTFGMGMTAGDVAQLSQTIDLDAVRGYYEAVYEETRRFVRGLDFDTLQTPLGERVRRHALDLVGGDKLMHDFLEPDVWLLPGTYLNICALMDVYYHLDEAEHMLHLVQPDGQFV
jgi:hypothetical protein